MTTPPLPPDIVAAARTAGREAALAAYWDHINVMSSTRPSLDAVADAAMDAALAAVFDARPTERVGEPCHGAHPERAELKCVYPDGHYVHFDGGREIWLSPTVADDMARAAGWADAVKALRDAAEALKRDWGLATEDMNVDVLLRHLLEAVAARAIESDRPTTQDGA